MLLPMLTTLYLAFQSEEMETSCYTAVLNSIWEFVVVRREQGRPLQKLQLSFIPPSLFYGEDIEMLRSELGQVEIVKFIDEFAS
jgi:hypothetical protein